jgi:hypothetical protein
VADLNLDAKRAAPEESRAGQINNNRLKWNEEHKLKSDMMLVPERWTKDRAPIDAVKAEWLGSRYD